MPESVGRLRYDQLHLLVASPDVLDFPLLDDSPYNPWLCRAVLAPLHGGLLSDRGLCRVNAVSDELPLVPCLVRLGVWRTDK